MYSLLPEVSMESEYVGICENIEDREKNVESKEMRKWNCVRIGGTRIDKV